MATAYRSGTFLNIWSYFKALIEGFKGTAVGGVTLTYAVVAATLTGDVDVIIPNKMRVINVWCVNTAAGAAADTITVKNGTNAITDVMDINVADKIITRALTIDDAFHNIASGGTLRITGASGAVCIVYVQGILVA